MDFLVQVIRGLVGIVSLLGICYLLSNNKKNISWQLVLMGMGLQFLLAISMLKVGFVRDMFQYVVDFFVVMIDSSEQSAKFLFGDLASPVGYNFNDGDGNPVKIGFGFAFFVLPTIVFFSALSSLLYYLGILQKVVYAFAWVMKKTMKLTGVESLAAAANVFIGQTEAPLVIKPYLERMTKSEMMTLMTGGMATIAGGVFGAYMGMLGGNDPEQLARFGMHLLTASIISAPAAIVAAKMLYPEDEEVGDKDLHVPKTESGSNFLDALTNGITDGLKLAVNVGAMLLGYMALVYLVNKLFLGIGDITGLNDIIVENFNNQFKGFTLEFVFGMLFAPIAWLIGISGNEVVAAGQMLGEKTILNEFVAYFSLMNFNNAGVLSERTVLIMTYALCGFANFASIGIQIGGIGAIAPGRRKTLTELGLKALIGGTIAALLTACIAGMIV